MSGFPFFESCRVEHIEQALGLTPVERGVLLTDGYTAYEHYTKKTGLTHAQCWAHTRRKLFEVKTSNRSWQRGAWTSSAGSTR